MKLTIKNLEICILTRKVGVCHFACIIRFCSHCLCFQCEGFVSNTGAVHESRVFLCSKGRLGRKSTRSLKITLPHSATIQTPYPSWCNFVGMNVLPNEIQNNSVSSTIFMKLTIKVVAFFLGHPVLQIKTLSCFNVKATYLNCFNENFKTLDSLELLLAFTVYETFFPFFLSLLFLLNFKWPLLRYVKTEPQRIQMYVDRSISNHLII